MAGPSQGFPSHAYGSQAVRARALPDHGDSNRGENRSTPATHIAQHSRAIRNNTDQKENGEWGARRAGHLRLCTQEASCLPNNDKRLQQAHVWQAHARHKRPLAAYTLEAALLGSRSEPSVVKLARTSRLWCRTLPAGCKHESAQ